MMLAKQKPPAPSLSIVARKRDPLYKTIVLKPVKPFTKIISRPREPALIPFELWIMPPQEEGYIKCPKFDFL
ncbi:MAG: hypothetical protein WDO16_21795 [Bacteroidota bacterium]